MSSTVFGFLDGAFFFGAPPVHHLFFGLVPSRGFSYAGVTNDSPFASDQFLTVPPLPGPPDCRCHGLSALLGTVD